MININKIFRFKKPAGNISMRLNAPVKILLRANGNFVMNSRIKKHTRSIKKLFEMLFESYIEDMKKQRKSSVIFGQFLKDMKQNYIDCHQPAEIVRDFISGMTDQYFLDQCPESGRPVIESI